MNNILQDLFIKYGLVYDAENPSAKTNDVYKHKHYTIITRQGIQKIESKAGIQCTFKLVPELTRGPDNIVFEVFASMPSAAKNYQTFASVSPDTCTNKYYVEMCEKRGRSRAVLTLAGLYEQGVFGEDEADSFSDAVKTQQSGDSVGAKYKPA